ncbi:MAG: hypothetical protein C7B43_03775 [Sulfobacillus benefaciens]|uniref:Cas12f1-like TNB domain-containing protein n=1 Tax=Sulfobacillus benefaciens TaxID=453960 RepID=A0A2T2X8Z3_9FIRM|nr:MAG: hypothetical protein C7B43_03775 [Sulfobacillus benefaciens]
MRNRYERTKIPIQEQNKTELEFSLPLLVPSSHTSCAEIPATPSLALRLFIKSNGHTTKAGINRAILSSVWGQLVPFTTYKIWRQGRLAITVPYAYSSQECAACTFTSADNRLT